MEKEYYTPEISELFVGYECQIIQIGNPKEVWLESLIDNTSKFIRYDYLIKNKALRTKYLDKQDIIDLGWNYGNGVTKTLFPMFKIDDKTTLFIHLFKGSIKITKCHSYDDNFIQEVSFETIFDGVCKSKNELSKLMKDYLNIPI